MKKTVLFGILILCVSAMLLAAPAGGSFVPTIQVATETINANAVLLATAPANQQFPLVLALNRDLSTVDSLLDEYAGMSTLNMTVEERETYAQAVTDANLAIRNCYAVAQAKNKTLLITHSRSTVNALITFVTEQANEDAALYNELLGRAPASGSLWGTVS